MKMEPNWWTELDRSYNERLTLWKTLHNKYGDAVLVWLPSSELACKKLVEMVL